MFASGHVDHRGREIDADDIESQIAQMGGDVPRPAARVPDLSAAVGANEIGEQR